MSLRDFPPVRQSDPVTKPRLEGAIGSCLHEDRCIGCLLGCAAGDILGANVEFKSREEILRNHGRVRDFLHSEWRPCGMFTDDTEMTIALATSLIECGRLDPQHCAATYARFFAAEPRRGYGPAVSRVLTMLCQGADYRATGRAIYPEGSFANGGAMRIAPVGLTFRYSDDGDLREAVRLALLCTHVHLDAIDGAFIQARAIAELSRSSFGQDIDMERFLGELRTKAETKTARNKLEIVIEALAEGWTDEELLASICTPNEHGKQFQIHAAEAVACALWAFACCQRDPEECIIRAVSLGGDADTVGALVGALAGALHGTSWLPRRWFDGMENAPGIGRDHLIDVARKLAGLDVREIAAGEDERR